MSELRRIGAPLSPFAEARAQIDAWERDYPQTERIVLILDADELVVTVTGPGIKGHVAAGLCFTAAQAVLE